MAKYYRIPLAEVLYDAKHGNHTHFELITTQVTLQSNLTGIGYTYTGGKGGGVQFIACWLTTWLQH